MTIAGWVAATDDRTRRALYSAQLPERGGLDFTSSSGRCKAAPAQLVGRRPPLDQLVVGCLWLEVWP